MRIRSLALAAICCSSLAACALLAPCSPYCNTVTHNSSSLLQFLYPNGAQPPVQNRMPELHVPLRVGLAFLPGSGSSPGAALTSAQQEELLEKIQAHFSSRRFVSQIVIIPDYYLTGVRGFAGLQGVQRLYDVDVIALVSYDQVMHQDVNGWSLAYWTIAGAYVIKGNRYDVATLVDLAVVDPATRSLVLRAGGTDTRHGNTTMIAEGREARSASDDGFTAATDRMIGHFDAALDRFQAQVRAGTAHVRVVHRGGSAAAGGGGGSLGWLELLVLLPFAVVRFRRAAWKRARTIMRKRFGWRALVLTGLALATASRVVAAQDFEIPADEAPGASLSASQVSGPSFHVEDPVHSDGLMHRYVIDSRFGVFDAYGIDALDTRLREVAALTTLGNTSDGQVVVAAAVRGVRDQAQSMIHVATHPVGTVLGIPKGIGHLLGGYRAEAQEVTTDVSHTLRSGGASQTKHSDGRALERAGTAATHAARSQAERYLGLTAAEQRWYAKLGVDPYTDNAVLRRAVTRMARIDAAASFGMRFAPVGIPFAGEVQRALNAIEHEDPAVLRKRRRESLLRAGLTADEIKQFEHTPLLTPTRQTVLVNAVEALNGVDGRAELLRHAMTVQSEEEAGVFLQSTLLLLRYRAHHPIKRILAGVRVPAAELADGRIAVFGAFDAVQWTAEVAAYEHALRQALPIKGPRQLWIAGSVSPRARAALEERGWVVHAKADTEPSEGLAPRAAS